ncbi:hypothetical protein FH608_034840 [Nonomuraea phyllanthi]|uniref:Uncharacterized protein n=1 Tax=Nonomuraea phyllanthi TaxID=2219224 RepID=A0A5C4VZJ3_9ACTN|nr:hypothetical protein [Nonomuraea phyllanthi]KAB8190685.1 hypothetical protein FH608_034840 [Nonomuraea phyllanthi]QFY05858.1 hypothetical protein GBF35_03495 [Nonomuraea phyllanthi]
MRFEEQLLMELKEEVGARAERRRRATRRLFAGGAVAALAAAAAVAVPLLTGSEPPAYAVSKAGDGTIRVEIKEFRDADQLERDLRQAGVSTDVTYLEYGTRCEDDRGRIVGGAESVATHDAFRDSASAKAARPSGAGVDIHPEFVGQGRTLVLDFSENPAWTPGAPTVRWQYRARVIEGQVKPCVVVDDPDAAASGS